MMMTILLCLSPLCSLTILHSTRCWILKYLDRLICYVEVDEGPVRQVCPQDVTVASSAGGTRSSLKSCTQFPWKPLLPTMSTLKPFTEAATEFEKDTPWKTTALNMAVAHDTSMTGTVVHMMWRMCENRLTPVASDAMFVVSDRGERACRRSRRPPRSRATHPGTSRTPCPRPTGTAHPRLGARPASPTSRCASPNE